MSRAVAGKGSHDLASPVRLLDIDVAAANDIGDVAPPYFAVLWRDGRPLAGWREFNANGPPLRARAVALAAACAPVPSAATVVNRSVSVVICTRDRPDELERCLSSLPAQSLTPREIVVVDNASREATTRQVAEHHGVVYIREDRPGLDIARNTGAARAVGDIVAYTDDDTVLHPDWLRNLTAAFDSPAIWAVTGLVLPGELETPAQRIFEQVWSFGRGFERRDFGPEYHAANRQRGTPVWEIGAGANMAVRRSVFDWIGGFDERLDVGAAGCSGDSEFWYRILHAGGTCRYEPSAVVRHFHRRTMDGLRAQLRAYMRGHVAALLVQHERTRERGNLRRLLVSLPYWYLRQTVRRLRHGRTVETCMLAAEIGGCMSGVVFYLRAPADSACGGVAQR